MDAQATTGLSHRAGLGKASHIETPEPSIQDVFERQDFVLVKLGGAHDRVDVLTKPQRESAIVLPNDAVLSPSNHGVLGPERCKCLPTPNKIAMPKLQYKRRRASVPPSLGPSAERPWKQLGTLKYPSVALRPRAASMFLPLSMPACMHAKS